MNNDHPITIHRANTHEPLTTNTVEIIREPDSAQLQRLPRTLRTSFQGRGLTPPPDLN